MLPLTEPHSEKYIKKLIGNTANRTDIEDALRRLDRLTDEEAQMAAAQVLKATHATDDTGKVRGVADIALGVDNRVVGVDNRVARVDNRVADVCDQLKGVDNKVSAVMDGV